MDKYITKIHWPPNQIFLEGVDYVFFTSSAYKVFLKETEEIFKHMQKMAK